MSGRIARAATSLLRLPSCVFHPVGGVGVPRTIEDVYRPWNVFLSSLCSRPLTRVSNPSAFLVSFPHVSPGPSHLLGLVRSSQSISGDVFSDRRMVARLSISSVSATAPPERQSEIAQFLAGCCLIRCFCAAFSVSGDVPQAALSLCPGGG